jgi:NADH dehydrogenase
MRHSRILVLGGAGFVGRHIVARLVDRGAVVTVPTRRRAHARPLILLPTVEVIEADIGDDAVLTTLVARHDAVINLVGILQGSRAMPYGPEFAHAHVDLPRRVIAACERSGVRRLLHMSALGAGPQAASMYQRSKGDGEAIVTGSSLDWTIFKPSVIFGLEDRFLNLFARLAAWFPVLPVGSAETRFQPIFVGDVADAFVNALENEATLRKIYELAGPRVYTLRELVAFAAAASGHPRPVIGLPDGIARLQARLMEFAPGDPMLSRDNLDSMKTDNVSATADATAAELGLSLHFLETEASHYLAGRSPRARLGTFRARARR